MPRSLSKRKAANDRPKTGIRPRAHVDRAPEIGDERFRLFMEHVPAAVAMFDRDMRYLAVSRRWVSDYRLEDTDIIGRSHYEVFPEIPERWKKIHQRCLAGAIEKSDEDPFPRPDGTTDWVRWEVRPWRDRRGDVGGILIFTEVITERKRGEDALRRLATIVDTSDDAIFSKALDGTILSWNAGAERIYGYLAGEVIGRSISLLAPPDRPDEIPGILGRLKRGEAIEHYETVRVRKDGKRIDVALTISPIRDDGGHIIGASTIAHDITERKRAEHALLQSEAQKSAIIRGALDCIITMDHAGRIIEFNPAAETTFGYRRDDVLGREMAEVIIPPALRDRHRQGFARHLVTGKSTILGTRLEISAMRADGREFPVELTVSRDPASEPPVFIGFIRDITERRRAEDERAELLARERQARIEAERGQERLSLLAEASKALAGSLDYKTTLANVARLAVPGLADWCVVDALDADGVIRRVSVAHVDPSKIDMAREVERRYPTDPHASSGVPNVLRTGKPELFAEISDSMLAETARDPEHLRILRELGLTSAMVVPLVGRDRVVGAITLVAAQPDRHYAAADLQMAEELARRCALAIENSMLYRDAQALNVELEQRVALRTAQLEAANKELESFAYTVAHDLRTPLITINGFSQVLLEDYAPTLGDEAQGHLRQLGESARRMGELIDDLLDFSRLSRQPLNKSEVVVADIVRQAIADLDGARAHRHVDLVVGDLPSCQADPTLLKQVFANLLSNALKYTRKREAATIEIGWRDDPDTPGFHTYFVKDNGVGFDMRYAEKLFRVFQRLHRAEEYEGTGVGLAIVQRIVHRLGGRVWAEAEVDKGATFCFTLERSSIR
jgi:PAS domain S-box-containing protein